MSVRVVNATRYDTIRYDGITLQYGLMQNLGHDNSGVKVLLNNNYLVIFIHSGIGEHNV
jgi:hypothetical protein